jgi:Phosphohistidine phosphatase SixA
MKRLYILRHAKSDWPSGVDDKDRPLGENGKRHADALVKTMASKRYKPDYVLCSSAVRTRQTFAPVKQEWPDTKYEYKDNLYLASTGELFEELKSTDDEFNNIMIIGHNPGIHGLVQLLVGQGAPALVSEILGGYKTGCLSVLDCDCAVWSELLPAGNTLIDILGGKQLYRTL